MPAMFCMVVIGLSFSACQKKFDPKSYAPEQTFNGYSSSNQVAQSNLVAYWGFEGNITDSISGTSATNYGMSYTTGIRGQALQGGLGNYALFTPTTAIKNLQSMTLAYWVNTGQNPNGIMDPVCFVNSTQFWGNLDMFFDGQTPTSSVFKIHLLNHSDGDIWMTNWTLNNPWGNWIHVALSYDASSSVFVFFVNGVQFGTATQANLGPLNLSNFPAIVFGTVQFQTNPSLTTATTAQTWASYLTGALDQVRIYNKALGAADVKALYQLENLGK
jgi:concanavalin A-like lectin/glucanase superfamily protein